MKRPYKEKIAILGEGMTAKALRQKCDELGIAVTTVEEADLIVTSPGIAPSVFPKTNKEIISEIEWAYRLFKHYDTLPALIAVTGTNGKSTVTSLIGHILELPVGGNIGIPLIQFVTPEKSVQGIVVEVSSYQLECSTSFAPDIAVLLNLTPDHLSRHGSMEEYAAQKSKLIRHMTPDGSVVFFEDDDWIKKMTAQTKARLLPFSEQDIRRYDFSSYPLKGTHNALNMIASLLAAEAFGVSRERIFEKMKSFKSLPHRLEYVTDIKGRKIYNDSKATNPDSVRFAVNAFTEPVHIILSGDDKGLDMASFIDFLIQKTASITVFGGISDKVAALVTAVSPSFPFKKADSLAGAIRTSFDRSVENEVILFSPSSSSFDLFLNFEDRGTKFKQAVLAFKGELQ